MGEAMRLLKIDTTSLHEYEEWEIHKVLFYRRTGSSPGYLTWEVKGGFNLPPSHFLEELRNQYIQNHLTWEEL